jgi:hypothetical protein
VGWEPKLDRLGLWVAAAVVLILIAYGPFFGDVSTAALGFAGVPGVLNTREHDRSGTTTAAGAVKLIAPLLWMFRDPRHKPAPGSPLYLLDR